MATPLRAALESHGPTEGDRYLLLHGTPGSRRQFAPLLARAPREARCVLVDLLDHGEAPDELLAENRPVEEDLAAIAESIGAPITVIGSSYGGWLAARLASRRPDLVRAVVVIAGFATLEPSDLEVRRGALAVLQTGGAALDAIVASLPATLFGEHAATPQAASALATILEHTTPPRLERLLRRLLRFDDPALLVGEIEVPLTILHGQRDGVVPVARARRLAECAAGSRIVEIDTASHLLHVTHAGEVARAAFAPR